MSTRRKTKASPIMHQAVAQSYDRFVDGIKERIRTAQVKAALAANAQLVLHYWEIGRDILASQKREGWGAKVIDRLASDLQREFPKLSGYSARNLKYMRAFAEAWPDGEIVQQLVAQIPWGQNCVLLDRLKDLYRHALLSHPASLLRRNRVESCRFRAGVRWKDELLPGSSGQSRANAAGLADDWAHSLQRKEQNRGRVHAPRR